MVSERSIAEAETEFVLLRNIFEKQSDLPFSRKGDRKKEKNMVSFMQEQNIICSQTKLGDIGRVGSDLQVTWGLSPNEKEETFAMNDKNYYSSSGENYY